MLYLQFSQKKNKEKGGNNCGLQLRLKERVIYLSMLPCNPEGDKCGCIH